MTLGDFAELLSCLTFSARDELSQKPGIYNPAADTNRELIYKYLYTIKDLRNAIAHNDVIFDARFTRMNPSKAMKVNITKEIGLPYIYFDTITDYLILVCYYLKVLRVTKTEIKALIRDYERIIEEYKRAVNSSISAIVIHPDTASRLAALKQYI